MSRFQVKKVAVLGAGVMGAQAAAHLINMRDGGFIGAHDFRIAEASPCATQGM